MGYLSPALLLGALFCLGYGALAHVGGGRSVRDLIGFLSVSTLGFAVGQLLGTMTQSPFLQIGALHLFEASLTAWLLLAVALVLGRR
jgi:hypothetical protein